MFQAGCLLPADWMAMQRLQAHLLQMGGKFFPMHVFCHFMRIAFKTEASKSRLEWTGQKEWIYSTFKRRIKTTEQRDIKFPLVIYGKFQNDYIRRTQKAFLGKSNLWLPEQDCVADAGFVFKMLTADINRFIYFVADLFSKRLSTPMMHSNLNLSRHADTQFPSLPKSHFSQQVLLAALK
jgi:hypothetical protein